MLAYGYSFIEACSKALNEFSGVVSQISKSASMIDEVIAHIEATVLVQDTDFRGYDTQTHHTHT